MKAPAAASKYQLSRTLLALDGARAEVAPAGAEVVLIADVWKVVVPVAWLELPEDVWVTTAVDSETTTKVDLVVGTALLSVDADFVVLAPDEEALELGAEAEVDFGGTEEELEEGWEEETDDIVLETGAFPLTISMESEDPVLSL